MRTKMKMSMKKALSLVLAFVMVISILPLGIDLVTQKASAATASVSTAAQFNQAVAAATEPITITLTADIKNSTAPANTNYPAEYAYTGNGEAFTKLRVPAGKNVTLDLNGHNIKWINYVHNDEFFFSHEFTDPAYVQGTYMGVIENFGTLNIIGSGTVIQTEIDLDSSIGTDRAEHQRFCAIYNVGNLTVGGAVNVEMYSSFAEQSSDDRTGLTFSLYLSGIFNEPNAKVVSRANIKVGSFNALQVPSSWGAFGTTFCYGIYGGDITTLGGAINCEAYTGGYHTYLSCSEKCNFCSYAIGIYSTDAQVKVFNRTTINTKAHNWASKDCDYECWKDGGGVCYSVGVLTLTSDLPPVIGPGVNITTDARTYSNDQKGDVYVPGLTNARYSGFGFKSGNYDKPNALHRVSSAVAQQSMNINNMELHSAPGEGEMGNKDGEVHTMWWDGNGFFGKDSAGNTQVQPATRKYIGEGTYRNFHDTPNANLMSDNQYTVTSLSYVYASNFRNKDGTGNNTNTVTSMINGSPVQNGGGGQAIICYRLMMPGGSTPYAVSFGYKNLEDLSYNTIDDSDFARFTNSPSLVGTSVFYATNGTAKINPNSFMARYFGADPLTIQPTVKCGKVNLSAFVGKDRENPDPLQWTQSALGGAFNSVGKMADSDSVVVIFYDFFALDPTESYISVKQPGTLFPTNDKEHWADSENTITVDYTGNPIQYTGNGASSPFDLWFFNKGILNDPADYQDDERMYLDDSLYKVEYKKENETDSAYSLTGPTDPGRYTVKVTINDQHLYTTQGYNVLESTKTFTLVIEAQDPPILYGNGQLNLVYGETLGDKYSNFNWSQLFTIPADCIGTFSFAQGDATRIYPASTTSQTCTVKWTPTPGMSSYGPKTFDNVKVKVDKKPISFSFDAMTVREGARSVKYKVDISQITGLLKQDYAAVAKWTYNFVIDYSDATRAYDKSMVAGPYTYHLDPFDPITGSGIENYEPDITSWANFTIEHVDRAEIAPTLTITGKMQSGQKVRAVVGNVSADELEGLKYQWYSVSETGQFELITGATAKEYTVQDSDAKHYLGVAVYANEDDDSPIWVTITNPNETLTIDGMLCDCVTYDSPTPCTAKSRSFWEKLMDWIRRFIAALTGLILSKK